MQMLKDYLHEFSQMVHKMEESLTENKDQDDVKNIDPKTWWKKRYFLCITLYIKKKIYFKYTILKQQLTR